MPAHIRTIPPTRLYRRGSSFQCSLSLVCGAIANIQHNATSNTEKERKSLNNWRGFSTQRTLVLLWLSLWTHTTDSTFCSCLYTSQHHHLQRSVSMVLFVHAIRSPKAQRTIIEDEISRKNTREWKGPNVRQIYFEKMKRFNIFSQWTWDDVDVNGESAKDTKLSFYNIFKLLFSESILHIYVCVCVWV